MLFCKKLEAAASAQASWGGEGGPTCRKPLNK